DGDVSKSLPVYLNGITLISFVNDVRLLNPYKKVLGHALKEKVLILPLLSVPKIGVRVCGANLERSEETKLCEGCEFKKILFHPEFHIL
ncbi:hypothetical protein, partial [Leptospira borgpetersenii]|uniref:hypothetical protein n=1 Tax=Leptospira borgpetersenii TaxID=174 RepID=UPI001F39F116